jgi:hypothetical protein
MTSFFELKDTKYGSGPKAKVYHPYTITGVICETCKTTSLRFRVYPYECPHDARNLLSANRRPLPLTAHRRLVDTVRSRLHDQGIDLSELHPGAIFLPSATVAWKYRPVDCLDTGLGSAIVSARVKDAFDLMSWTGAAFFPVRVISLPGLPNYDGLGPIVAASLDDPEIIARERGGRIIDEPYYELVVVGESRWIWPLLGTCEACGSWDYFPARFCITKEQWLGHDIFRVLPTCAIAVTERVKRKAEQLGWTGFDFRSIGAGQDLSNE